MLRCVDNGLLCVFMLLASLKYSWVQSRNDRGSLCFYTLGHGRSRGWAVLLSIQGTPCSAPGREPRSLSRPAHCCLPRSRRTFSVTLVEKALTGRILCRVISPPVCLCCVSSVCHLLFLSVGCFTVLVIETRAAIYRGWGVAVF